MWQSTFLVVIINQLGYSSIASQGLTAPAYAREWNTGMSRTLTSLTVAALCYIIGAVMADRKNVGRNLLQPDDRPAERFLLSRVIGSHSQ